MNKRIIYKSATHLSTKRFGNRYYFIQVVFYEHNMAVAGIACRKHGVVSGYCRGSFDECKVESTYGYFKCLDGLAIEQDRKRMIAKCLSVTGGCNMNISL